MVNKDNSVTLKSGTLMPIIGLGTFSARGSEMRNVLNVALKCGYRSIDTAYLYRNEDAIGDEIQDWLSSGSLKREDLFVTSKLPLIANRSEEVHKFLKKTLKALKLEYVDLYLVHHPFGLINKGDNDMNPMDEAGNSILDHDTDIISIWKAMEEQVDAGLTKAIGISNFNIEQVHRLMRHARIIPDVNQVEAHVYLQQKPLMDVCKQYGIALCAFRPLGAPYMDKDVSDEFPILLEHEVVSAISKNHNKTPAQILLKFLVQSGFIVIPKSATPSRIKDNLDIFDFQLNDEEMKKLGSLDRGEKGRFLHFTHIFKGSDRHKEYPFK